MTKVFQAIGIVGLGQIGGSIGMALRKRAPELRLVGVEPNTLRAEKARVFMNAVSDQLDVLAGADWIILSVPVRTILRLLPELATRFPEAVVLDTGSTKEAVVEKALKFGADFHFVGGHPLAGSEKAGEAGWDPDLFVEHLFFLCKVTPQPDASRQAEHLVSLLGAHPVWVEPEIHDQMLAYSSHFAYLLSAIYLLQGKSGRRLRKEFLGSGFASLARLAGSPSQMGVDMLLTNRKNVLEELRAFKSTLNTVEKWLEKNQPEELKKWLRESETLWQEVKSRD
jgi:prephenate dehydrogenase